MYHSIPEMQIILIFLFYVKLILSYQNGIKHEGYWDDSL